MIITHIDVRFPLLQSESQPCGFPLTETDLEMIVGMNKQRDSLGSHAVGLAAVQVGLSQHLTLALPYNYLICLA